MKKVPIGFNVGTVTNKKNEFASKTDVKSSNPKKSLVDIYFPQRNMTLSYYNDMFDL